MQAFDRFLQKVEAGLRVPEPGRSRILLEMASDLEDLYQEYRARGLGEEEARGAGACSGWRERPKAPARSHVRDKSKPPSSGVDFKSPS